jgi:uncharacterized protein (UPF0333 family)
MGHKAQVSMEYMMLLGISLIVVGILWVTSGNNITDTQWDLQMAYAKNAIEKIVQTADVIYVQGPPAKTYVSADFPDNIRAIYIENNTLTMELWWKGVPRNITGFSISNLTGNINAARGRHRIMVSAGFAVNLTEA